MAYLEVKVSKCQVSCFPMRSPLKIPNKSNKTFFTFLTILRTEKSHIFNFWVEKVLKLFSQFALLLLGKRREFGKNNT